YIWVESAYNAHIIGGYDDGTFRPYNLVTRAQFVTMVCRALGWPLVNPPQPTFSDVPPGSTFYQYIETAMCHGAIGGYPNGTFGPYSSVTRGQVAKIVCLAARGGPTLCGTPTVTATAASEQRYD